MAGGTPIRLHPPYAGTISIEWQFGCLESLMTTVVAFAGCIDLWWGFLVRDDGERDLDRFNCQEKWELVSLFLLLIDTQQGSCLKSKARSDGVLPIDTIKGLPRDLSRFLEHCQPRFWGELNGCASILSYIPGSRLPSSTSIFPMFVFFSSTLVSLVSTFLTFLSSNDPSFFLDCFQPSWTPPYRFRRASADISSMVSLLSFSVVLTNGWFLFCLFRDDFL